MRQALLFILTLISTETFSQLADESSPLIRLSNLKIKLHDIEIFVDIDDESLTFKDTANLHLNLSETIQGLRNILTGMKMHIPTTKCKKHNAEIFLNKVV